MPGTREGGVKAAKTNKKRYGRAFYKRIGYLGGKKSIGGGFAYDRELASLAGKLGGLLSRKGGELKLTRAQKQQIKELKQRIAELKNK